MNERLAAIEQIQTDFAERNPPFDSTEFPQERLLDELPCPSLSDKAMLITTFSFLDYNRNASRLVDNLIELHEIQSKFYDPYYISNEREVEYAFNEVTFRYPNRDAATWHHNMSLLRDEYHGDVLELILDTGMDATALVSRVRADGFKCLGGDKIAPMYARLVSESVVELDNLWQLDLPVDVHTRRLSNDLFARFDGDTTTDDEIREIWRLYAERHGIERHVVDAALWQIGNNLEDWGRDYWYDVLQEHDLDPTI